MGSETTSAATMSDHSPVPLRPDPTRTEHSWSRLEAVYRRSVVHGHEVALLALELPDLERLAATNAVEPDTLFRSLTCALRALAESEGVVVVRREQRLIALLPAVSLGDAEGLARALVTASKGLVINGRKGRVVPVIGLSHVPGKCDLHLETLVRVAEAGARVASYRGNGSVVHTLLYDLIEGQVCQELATDRASVAPPPLRGFSSREAPVAAASAAVESPEPTTEESAHTAPAAAADPSRSTSESIEIDRLRRRVTKLLVALEQTEQHLTALQRQYAPDPGVASVYQSVQGLTGTEPDFELRKGLLRQILDANLALQDTLVARKQQPTPRPASRTQAERRSRTAPPAAISSGPRVARSPRSRRRC